MRPKFLFLRTNRRVAPAVITLMPGIFMLPGCATMSALMSPYAETFSCKNDDHGQCIHPHRAYADAVAGRTSRSDPAVTRTRGAATPSRTRQRRSAQATAFGGYRDSVYQELQGLIEAPATPMLRPPRTLRTLVLPYADRQRPDRLYMPRFVYSIVEKPAWVVGGYLVDPPASAGRILEQRRTPVEGAETGDAAPVPAAIATDSPTEPQP